MLNSTAPEPGVSVDEYVLHTRFHTTSFGKGQPQAGSVETLVAPPREGKERRSEGEWQRPPNQILGCLEGRIKGIPTLIHSFV